MDIDNIGIILKDRIKELGITQEEFASKTGIGLSSLKSTCLVKSSIPLIRLN